MGLTSRDGIVPLNLARDIGGPLARTVADAVVVFDVIAGYDAADPITAESQDRRPARYRDFLVGDGLSGARIGVLREMSDETADPEVIQRLDEALDDMRRLGAEIVDPVALPEQEARGTGDQPDCGRFRFDLEMYLASLRPDAPVKSLEEILESRNFHPTIRQRLESAQEIDLPPSEQPGCHQQAQRQERLRARVRSTLQEHELDAIVYPSWDNPPRLIGDLNSPHGNNSPQLSPPTGFPSLSVPMGFVRGGLPVGLQILGDAWSEPSLIAIAYSFEQGTQHRVPPPGTPELRAPGSGR